jgi:hypothetical protein
VTQADDRGRAGGRAAGATRRLYAKYLYGDLIIDLHRSTLLTDDGDLTETRDDNTDNWQSEMHETYCFWSLAGWCRAVEQAALQVLPASRGYTNPWLVDDRYRGKAELFVLEDGALRPMAYPATTMPLVTEKL